MKAKKKPAPKPKAKKAAPKAKKPRKKRKPGVQYDPARHPILAHALAKDGLIDQDLADAIGIARETVSRWRKAHPEFEEAISGGKAGTDSKVESALLRSCLGTEYTETKVICAHTVFQNGKPCKVPERKEIMHKKQHGIVSAQIFWTCNRMPDRWKNIQRVEVGGKLDFAKSLESLTDEQLAEVEAKL